MSSLKKLLAVAASFATACHSFNIDFDLSWRARAANARVLPSSAFSSREPSILRRSVGPLHLFDSLLQKQEGRNSTGQWRSSPNGSSLHRIPREELDFLGSGFGLENTATPPFPYSIDLLRPGNGKSSNRASRLIIRHLEDEDIKKILPEVVREFGALAPLPSTPPEPGDELADKIENYLFSLTVLIGLTQRVVRREKGYSPSNSACPDHDVICLVEQIPRNTTDNNEETDTSSAEFSEQIVGMAELSWQPPNPNSNAPPFVLPFFMKTLISRFAPSRDGTSADKPVGYISNVLVWKTRRGRGYARVMMAALEGIAKNWGCDDVRLHVDANDYSGRTARGLYWSLGYEGVPDRGSSKVGYEWMGPGMANQGLYLVDGVPLLYLRKSLKET